MARPKTTRLSSDLTQPQPTAPGDAPADTWDPNERASSAQPDKAAAAADGHLTVNAVVPVAPIPEPEVPVGGRTETYTAYGPNGQPVEVSRNVETGATEIEDGDDPDEDGDDGEED